jgi:hypothetical protein
VLDARVIPLVVPTIELRNPQVLCVLYHRLGSRASHRSANQQKVLNLS